MTIYLLDTNHVSAILRHQSTFIARQQEAGDAVFGVSIPSVAELWFMIFNSAKIEENGQNLDRVLADLEIWSFNELAAREFGQIKAELRRVGKPIPDLDVQIAAIALNGLTLLTGDKHFAHVTGLKTENWLA